MHLPPERLESHVAIMGGTGRGKSTLLGNLAVQLLRRGTGFTLLDPEGDLAKAVLRQIPKEREGDAVYIDVADREYPFPLNILSAKTDIDVEFVK